MTGFFAPLEKDLKKYLHPRQIADVARAYQLAEKAHQGQCRQSGEAYITHPVAVSQILAALRLDHETIMAALLHDVLEDTGIDKTMLQAEFGEAVTNIVDGVSKLDKIKFKNRAEAQAESFRKMLISMSKDIRVIILKLADRLHNMRTLSVLNNERRQRIAQETLEIYAPIAHRLGMNQFRVELEDLGFHSCFPWREKILKNSLKKHQGHQKNIVNEISKNIEKQLKKLKVPIVATAGRRKHLYGIYKKMKENSLSFKEINDVYAFRIICEEPDDCYRILGIVHQLYKPLPGQFKDYIAIPKINGYQSLHTLLFGPQGLPIEIQIRTQKMHKNAEFGIAAHWLYKSPKTSMSEAAPVTKKWLQALMEIQKNTQGSLEFIENVKTDLFPDDIYLFTPQGDILALPQGATPIDFAYAVHTDVGNHCMAARVNHQLIPLNKPLSTGETIEIVTAKGARPNPSWLQFVVSAKARSNIRHFLKSQHKNSSISLGNRLLANALKDLSLSLEKIPEESLNNLLKENNLNALDDLLELMGLGEQHAFLVAKRLAILAGLEQPTYHPKKESLAIQGTEGMAVQFASCCFPIPGDPIIALLEKGEGLIVHHALCKASSAATPDPQHLTVYWHQAVKGKFKSQLNILIVDQPGMLAEVATIIARLNTNILHIHSETNATGYSEIILLIEVTHRQHLSHVIKALRTHKNIVKISRFH